MKPDRMKPLDEQTGVVLLALLGWGEARGEGPLGIAAVQHVVRNRSLRSGKPVEQVILAPLQFSCFNHNDPNYPKLLMADDYEPVAWGMCSALAIGVLGGWIPDPTGGALNYYAASMPNPPASTKDWRETAVIGNQIFGVAS